MGQGKTKQQLTDSLVFLAISGFFFLAFILAILAID